MNGHLNQDQLIRYRFGLDDDAEHGAAERHLAECQACREALAGLDGKFASLDLLAGEVGVSDELMAATLAGASSRSAGRRLAPHSVWYAIAAALIVATALGLVALQGWKWGPREVATTGGKPAEPVVKPETTPKNGDPVIALGGPDSRDGYNWQGPAVRLAGGAARPAGLAEDMDDKPPFAPASAIELVTLPRRENLQLTIYNSADLTMVRERRTLTFKRGWNWLQLMWANTLIDPTSITLEPLEHKAEIDVQQLVYPARLKDIGRWLIRSEVEGAVPVEITYFTSGLSWRAFYMGALSEDERTMDLQGYVRVENRSGEDYEDAQTRLLVGRVHLLDEIAELARRRYPYGGGPQVLRELSELKLGDRPIRFDLYDMDALDLDGNTVWAGKFPEAPMDAKEIVKEGLSEYFLYTIEGTETIPNEWGKRLPSLEAEAIEVDNLYKYDEERWGRQTIRFLSFTNDEEHNLAETPLPDGKVMVYRDVGDQTHLTFVGEAATKYVPVGEEAELNLGRAHKVKVEPKLMDSRTLNYRFDGDGNVDGYDQIEQWSIEVTNTRDIPVKIEITRDLGTPYWDIEQANPGAQYEKHDTTHVRFTLTVAAGTQRRIEYTVTTYTGTRIEPNRR